MKTTGTGNYVRGPYRENLHYLWERAVRITKKPCKDPVMPCKHLQCVKRKVENCVACPFQPLLAHWISRDIYFKFGLYVDWKFRKIHNFGANATSKRLVPLCLVVASNIFLRAKV